MTKKTVSEHIQNIQEFANKFNLTFDRNGKCGFGRDCVGISSGGNWVDYNPMNRTTYDYIEEFYDDRLHDVAPEKAYHKHNCLAVLGHEDESIIQLSEWVDALKSMNAIIEQFDTGAEGIQAIITGKTGYAVKIPKEND